LEHIQGRGEVHMGFWWGKLVERDHLDDLGVDGNDNVKLDLQEIDWGKHGLD